MQIRALKTFAGHLGLIRAGTVITVDSTYGSRLIANGLAAVHDIELLSPDRNVAHESAPIVKADEGNTVDDIVGSSSGNQTDEQKLNRARGATGNSSEDSPADGGGRRSSSRRAGRRSRRRI